MKDFEIRTSADGRSWSDAVAQGPLAKRHDAKYVPLSGPPARYVQLRGLNEVEGRPFMSAAEVSRWNRNRRGRSKLSTKPFRNR